jgi:predicted nucleic acid-binding protein
VNYFDTSALVKRFVEEPGSPVVDGLMAEGPTATASVAFAEVHAGLARKRRARELTEAAYRNAYRQFETEWPAYIRVALRDDVLVLARDLIQRHPLRGFDAIHLASALILKAALVEDVTFVASDERLLTAAQAEHLTGMNPEENS